MAIDADIQKKSWADDVDELGGSLVGAGDAIRAKSTDQASKVDEDGVRVVVEYAVDDQGKKIKVLSLSLAHRKPCVHLAETRDRSSVPSDVPSRKPWSSTSSPNAKSGPSSGRNEARNLAQTKRPPPSASPSRSRFPQATRPANPSSPQNRPPRRSLQRPAWAKSCVGSAPATTSPQNVPTRTSSLVSTTPVRVPHRRFPPPPA